MTKKSNIAGCRHFPFVCSFFRLKIGNALPNFGFLSSISSLSGNVDFARAMKILKDNLMVVFDSMNASIVSGFTNNLANNLSGGMRAIKIN